ncbi:hypothetical protein [Bradyrhizobium canariense]|uniref:hypothetical protein n=1 Tax=Bradyrhizobium canariense TaxID=255045 RepID=UPI001CA54316|nr:hypothetical protein [Bradyrhizobium canariense]
MQQDPRITAECSREMGHHGIDANEQIEPLEEMTENRNVRCADVPRADLGQFARSGPALQRAERHAGNVKLPQQGRRDGPSFVPVADFPNQTDGKPSQSKTWNFKTWNFKTWNFKTWNFETSKFKTSHLRKCWRDRRRQRYVRCPHLDVLPPRPYGMRHLHDFDIGFEVDLRRTIMERKGPIDASRSLDQRQKLALAPDRDPARDVTKRPHEAQELDGVAEPVVAADQHILARQLLAAPDTLQVPRPGVLGWIRKHRQIAVADRPGAFEVACPHRFRPTNRHSR